MSRDLRVLDQLGEELERAARRSLTGSRRLGTGAQTRRFGAIAIALIALALTAAAAAAVLLIRQGSPLPGPHAQDLRSQGSPLPGSARLAGLDAADPADGEPPWDLRLSRTSGGETCATVGQVLGGRLGIVGLDHVFRALPLDAVDSCGFDAPDAPVLIGAQTFVGRTSSQAVTVVSGVAGSGARAVTVQTEAGTRHLRVGPLGSFITVYSGEAEQVRPTVTILDSQGHSRTAALEQSPAFSVPDPAGGAGWAVSTEPDLQGSASPDESCVQVARENSQSEPGHELLALTPEICGHLGDRPLFVQMRRFVPGERSSPYPWGDEPSRTVVYGVATPRVQSLELSSGAGVSSVPIDRHGGAFAAVLDGHVDPRSLTLKAQLADGSTVTYDEPTGLLSQQTNEPLGRQAVPAYRAPLPIRATLPPPLALPIAASAVESLHSPDPSGGPEWVMRSWRARPNPRVRGLPSELMSCAELAVRWHGRLLAPTADPSRSTPPLNREVQHCNGAVQLARMRYMLSYEAFLSDPDAYSPQPGRVVASGLLPPGAKGAVLLGLGAPRPLRLDTNDAFLAVLPGRLWKLHPRISYLLHGHRVGRLANKISEPRAFGPQQPDVRAPDPDGAAPWGFTAGRDCSTTTGRVVDGILASIDPTDGVLQKGPMMSGGSSYCITRDAGREPSFLRHEPVEFNMEPVDRNNPFSSEPTRLEQPEVEGRTLPGRTIITGIARPDVASVTISTPSDVRTLRPEGPLHTIISVYAGFFTRGALTATVRLTDGRTRTEAIANFATGGFSPPSLSEQLRRDRELLAELRNGAAGPISAHSRAGDEGAIAQMRDTVARIELRLAYMRAHPGRLPAE
jgi:hypothetical protein